MIEGVTGRRVVPLLFAAALGALVPACGVDSDPPASGPSLDLPARPDGTPGGRAFARALAGLDVEAREERIVAEVARGNIPNWLRPFRRVETTVEADGRSHEITFWAAPDYLAVGSDEDFVYVPLSPRSAERVARMAGGGLPTPVMVDAAWRASRDRLIPIRFRPNEEMGSVRYLVRHNRVIRAQRQQHDAPPGAFVAGHKLDVVRSSPDGDAADTLALYGWHRSDGVPIQPLYPVAADLAPHYSVGLRIVDDEVIVDGVRIGLREALEKPELAGLLGG